MTMALDSGKVVSLMHRPTLPPGNVPGSHFCSRLSRPQGHSSIGRIICQWKIPMTPAGIEPATFRFLAQYLNHCTKGHTDIGAHNYGYSLYEMCVTLTTGTQLTFGSVFITGIVLGTSSSSSVILETFSASIPFTSVPPRVDDTRLVRWTKFTFQQIHAVL